MSTRAIMVDAVLFSRWSLLKVDKGGFNGRVEYHLRSARVIRLNIVFRGGCYDSWREIY